MIGQNVGKRLFGPVVKVVQLFVPRQVVGVLCVIMHEGKVVWVRHTYGNRLLWQLPGGLVKPEEAPRTAIIREIDEELSVTPLKLVSLGETEVTFGRRVTKLHLFSAELGGQVIHHDCGEIAEHKWFPVHRSPNGIGPGSSRAMKRHRALLRIRMTP
jgi:8-oxo-dGTP pyrophosphatase MutT (NUDIX family)